jgi:hypothetical protein
MLKKRFVMVPIFANFGIAKGAGTRAILALHLQTFNLRVNFLQIDGIEIFSVTPRNVKLKRHGRR